MLPFRKEAIVTRIDWDGLGIRDSRRLRELGFDEGVAVEPLHAAGWVVRDPIAVRIGRMTVAIRRAQALRIAVCPVVDTPFAIGDVV